MAVSSRVFRSDPEIKRSMTVVRLTVGLTRELGGSVFRAFLMIGAAIDLLIALILVIVFGWIIDSWHDRDPWAGPIVTTLWFTALVLSAGAPIVAYWLSRRKAASRRVALAVWSPAVLLTAICVIGFIISPP
jgi:ABC-type amino acid transport system permease subunit